MSEIPQKSSQPFDDALPERLLQSEEEKNTSHVVRTHVGMSNVTSPYIVKLSHGKGEPVGETLIVEDADIFPDEAPLVEYHEGKLHFAEDHTLAQIVEGMAGEREVLPLIGPYPAAREYDQALPLASALSISEPRDIFAELFLEDSEESGEEKACEEQIQEEENPIATNTEETLLFEPVLLPRKGWKVHAKASLAFATLAAVVLLPLQASFVFANAFSTKQEVEVQSAAGLSQFLRGANALQEQDFSVASTLFENASGAFASASASLNDIHGAVAAAVSLIPATEKTAATAQALLDIGEGVSRASTLLTRGMGEVSAAQALSVTDRLALMAAYTEEALPEMEKAARASTQIDLAVIPKDMQDRVTQMTTLLPSLAQSFQEVVAHADALGTLLGAEGKRTYMVVFQNNTELRPTGGFMGSFAEVSFDDGAITNMRIPGGGTYDVQGQLHAFVASPGPLQLVRARWEFQDANWFPDFPTSARKMLWFYESAGGPSVDGVLSINANVLEKMLIMLGPITLSNGTELNAENVLFEIQKEAEISYDDARAPKAVVGELTELIFAKLAQADAQTLLQVAGVFVDALNGRDMQVYFSDNTLESTMKDLGWTGEIRSTGDDYLMVVHTNVGGGKTDTVIDRDVTVDAYIAEDGTIENTVTLTQTHRGMPNGLFTGMNNVDYVRLYVPEGSTFITGTGFEVPAGEIFQKAEYPLEVDEDLAVIMQNVTKDAYTGTDIWNEQGKTVLGNWVQTAPGETQTVTFTYRLPWRAIQNHASGAWSFAKQVLGAKEALSYAMVVQKQSGVAQSVFVHVHVPDSFAKRWSSYGTTEEEFYEEDQKNDLFTGWIFER